MRWRSCFFIPFGSLRVLPINELDDEMAELLFHTVRKLEGITDEAFAQLYIAPDSMMDD